MLFASGGQSCGNSRFFWLACGRLSVILTSGTASCVQIGTWYICNLCVNEDKCVSTGVQGSKSVAFGRIDGRNYLSPSNRQDLVGP